MKIHYILTLIVGAFFISLSAIAQNIQSASIEWRTNLTSISQPDSIATEVTKLVSTATDITWFNEDGSIRKTLSIVKAIGSWSNVSNDGAIMFLVNSNGNSGTVRFSRVRDLTQISIQIIESGGSAIFDLSVTSVNAL
jgi:hypothetical protein